MRKRSDFITNLNCIEIVTTYSCNRHCYNCQAMVRQAPSNEFMTIEQIKRFIYETVEEKIEWNTIRILGGEPTLHPDIVEIVSLLYEYKRNYSKDTKIVLVTNGYGDVVNNVIKVVSGKYDIIVENSNKISDYQEDFTEINDAPVDSNLYDEKEYTKGCWITSLCGMALDLHGYYMCSTAAAIDRVIGFDLGYKTLAIARKRIMAYRNTFCKLCGHFNSDLNNIIDFNVTNKKDIKALNEVISKELEKNVAIKADNTKKTGGINVCNPVISDFWVKAISDYKISRPTLSKY